ncbi:MAG: thermonuclease family protein [Rickettsiales bacterium]|nr:thermonuclease family protein [Rickettsiales bacterium]
MKEKLLKTLVIIFIGVFSSFIYEVTSLEKPNQFTSEQPPLPDFKFQFRGKAFAVDGDSVKIKNDVETKNVRLFGIDAPEYSQTCFDGKDQEYDCGKISKKFLSDLINNKEVTCYYNNKDIYNRYLAKCRVDGISINEKILENGMAIIYDFKQSDEKMISLEESAKTNKIGIWQGKFQIPKEYRKSHPHKK